MSRKKRKQQQRETSANPAPAEADPDAPLGYNPFANIKPVVKAARARESKPAPPRPAPPVRRAPDPDDVRWKSRPVPTEMTEEELFHASVAAIDNAELERGKYAGKGPDTRHIRVKEEARLSPAEVAALGAPADPYHDDVTLFEDLMRRDGVRAVEQNLFVVEASVELDTQRKMEVMMGEFAAQTPRHAILDELERPGGPSLGPAQRFLLKEIQKAVKAGAILPTTNVRGDTREVAILKVEQLCREAAVSSKPYVRVITGKGLNSEDKPVLKGAVVDWSMTAGDQLVHGWAPELLADGTFGSIILHVRRQRHTRP